ncbi:MAG: HD domain-containing protein [Candidatus Aenigmarchaeota archaeon]|nr:HD domain-containing protein [Candidatus Aenigmarchaeota archaeon]
MNKEKLLKEAENFMRNNIPETRDDPFYFRHVLGARKYAVKLANVYNADIFVVEMAALLHDVGADAGKGHAKESVEIGRKFLSRLDLPKEIVKKILDCIETHSTGSSTETLEQQIIQDADGLIFLEDSYIIFLKSRKEKFPLEEAKRQTKEKTNHMVNKVKTEEGKKIAKTLLHKAMEYIESAS